VIVIMSECDVTCSLAWQTRVESKISAINFTAFLSFSPPSMAFLKLPDQALHLIPEPETTYIDVLKLRDWS
jgi:hypothetical protein